MYPFSHSGHFLLNTLDFPALTLLIYYMKTVTCQYQIFHVVSPSIQCKKGYRREFIDILPDIVMIHE